MHCACFDILLFLRSKTMNRRHFIQTTLAASLAPAATAAVAHGDHSHRGPDHAHNHAGHGAAAENARFAAVHAAALSCVGAGKNCLAHCVRLLSAGDQSMAQCAKNVNQMLALCTAVMDLAAQNSDLLPQVARACVKACEACAAACKEHINHHAECRACYESCVKCAQECGKIAA